MDRVLYGKTHDGQEIEGFILRNANGMEVRCINYGCRMTDILLPNAGGGKTNVLLGFDSLEGYEGDTASHGAFVGRYAGRIAGAAFELGGQRYALTAGTGGHYLHGSFSGRVFEPDIIGDNSISLTYNSPGGEDGFPGDMWVGVIYTLTDQNELVMDFRAVAQADTHINLTNHNYYNLAGAGAGSIEDHLLQLNCDLFLESTPDITPTGRLLETAGGAFDFSQPKPIGRDIGANDPQLKAAGGYDHCFVVNRERSGMLAHAATASHPASGRALRVYTTQPGLVFYAGNMMDPAVKGRGGVPMAPRTGFCLETQHFPDSPNQPDFPSTLLRAGEKFHQITVLQFEW